MCAQMNRILKVGLTATALTATATAKATAKKLACRTFKKLAKIIYFERIIQLKLNGIPQESISVIRPDVNIRQHLSENN